MIKFGKFNACIDLHDLCYKNAFLHSEFCPSFGGRCARHFGKEDKSPACNLPAQTHCQRQLLWALSRGQEEHTATLVVSSINNIPSILVKRRNFAELSALEQVGLLLYN